MKKQQQWWLLFKVFSSKTTLTPPPLINSSSSSSSYNNALRARRPFCSLATTTTTTTTNTSSLFDAHAVKKKKKKNLPLLIVPYDDDDDDQGRNDGDGFKKMKERKQGYSSTVCVCDDTLGFTSLFDDDDDDVDLQKKKKALVHKMYLPEIADRRICGSSEGWLITVHENTEVQLLNPFSKVFVNLPPLLTSFPEVVVGKLDFEKDNYKGLCYLVHEDTSGYYEQTVSSSSSADHGSLKGYDSHYFRDTFFKKVVTSTTTTDALLPTTVVMAIYGEAKKLAFCRTSGNNNDDEQKRWMGRLQGDRGFYDDVTFYKGNFYAVDFVRDVMDSVVDERFGDVVVVKGLDGPSPFVETIIEGERDLYYRYTCTNYLVKSSSSSSSTGGGGGGGGGGDLLKVMRLIGYPYDKESPYRTTRFRVFKLDFNNGGSASSVEVTNLGEDCALFIGYNHSFSFAASKIPGCRGNCIYFTDNNSKLFHTYGYGGHDMGVYNLEDGSIERLNYETTSSSPYLIMPPPIWYVPN